MRLEELSRTNEGLRMIENLKDVSTSNRSHKEDRRRAVDLY